MRKLDFRCSQGTGKGGELGRSMPLCHIPSHFNYLQELV